MEGFIDWFINISHAVPDYLMYILLGLSAFVENIFPPIPGDTIMAFGAFLVGVGRLNFFWVYFAATIGSLAGFMSLFELSRFFGRALLEKKSIPFINQRQISNAENWFKRYGYMVVVINRFLPGLRSAVSISGGIFRLKRVYVGFLAFISCAVWNLIWISIGYLLGNNWDIVKTGISSIMRRYNITVSIFLGAVILYFLIRWITRSRHNP